jgi:choline monooxygenase
MNAPHLFPLHDLRHMTAGIREPLARAHHLPAEVYVSPEIQQIEKAQVFMKHWLCVGRVEELPNKGDYTTLRIADEPIVVARDAEGAIVAYSNMCLHRGVEIAYGEGNARRFTCPYHAWTYDTGGTLIVAPLMKEAGIDVAGRCIPRIKTAEWRGWIFVNFDADAQPFADMMAPYEEAFWWYRGDDVKLALKKTIEVDCNWKFIVENLLDFYHASTVHAGTFGHQYKLKGELPATRLPGGAFNLEMNSSIRPTDPKMLFFPTIPWTAERGVTLARGLLFPNMILTAVDSLRMWTMLPISPGKTRVTANILLPHSSFEMPDLAERVAKFESFTQTFLEEDRQALESLQRAASSDRMQPGPLSPFEVGIHHFLNHYLDVVGL